MIDSVPAVPQVVLVAGGLGTRLAGTLPPGLPKILAPINGTPFLSLILTLLADQGVGRVHLCLGVGSAAVIEQLDVVERHAHPGLLITTNVESAPLGTAGCLRMAESYLDEEFILLLGDTYTPVDLAEVYAEYRRIGCAAAMTVIRNRDWLVQSNVRVSGDRVVEYDKTKPLGTFEDVDYGIAVLRRDLLHGLPQDAASDLSELYDRLIAAGQLAAVRVWQRFYEIGSPASHADLTRRVEQRELPALSNAVGPDFPAPSGLPKSQLDSTVRYASPWLTLREDTIVEPDRSVASFAVVTRADSVIVVCEPQPGSLLMTYQYRYAVGRWSLELPQGQCLAGENPIEVAIREVREETGMTLASPVLLAECLHEAGDWATQGFAVVRGEAAGHQTVSLDPQELGLEVRVVPRDRLASLVASGEIFDAATLAALWIAGTSTSSRRGSEATPCAF